MKLRALLLIAGLAGSTALATGQVNSPLTDGYINRGLEMYRLGNYNGCIDQLTTVERNSLTLAMAETIDWTLAMAAYHTSGDGAMGHFQKFLAAYPQSLLREQAKLRIADCLMCRSYPEALKAFAEVDADALPANLAEERNYKLAFCYMYVADFKAAKKLFESVYGSREWGGAAKFYSAYIDYSEKRYDEALKAFQGLNTSTNPSMAAPYYMAQIYFIKGDWQNTVNTGLSVLRNPEMAPDFIAPTQRVVGEAYYRLGNAAEARKYLEQYVASTPEPMREALYILGLSQYETFDYPAAAESFKKVLAGEEPDVLTQSAALYTGQALLKTGDINGALLAFNTALQLDFDKKAQETAFYNYAVAKFAGGNIPFSSAAATFEEFLRKFPDSPHDEEIQEYVVNGYLSDKNYNGVLTAVEKLKKPSSKALQAKQQALYMLGAQALQGGNVSPAVYYLSQAAKLAQYDSETARQVQLLLGEAQYRDEDYQQSTENLLAYINSARSNDQNLPLARYDLGYTCYAQKKYSDAATNFNTALQLLGKLPADAQTTVMEADIYSRLGDIDYYASKFEAASKNYAKALEINENVGDYPLYQLAIINGFNRDYKGKLARLAELEKQYPNSPMLPDALLETTEAQIQTGNPKGAISTYERLIERFEESPQARQAYLQMALLQINGGDLDAAENSYKRLISTYPSSQEAADGLKELQRLSADNGTLAALNTFLKSIKGAPQLSVSEMDRLTFEAAEKALLSDGNPEKMEAYLNTYPSGSRTAQALGYLMDEYNSQADKAKAYIYASRLVAEYPDSKLAETGALQKARYEESKGDFDKATESYKFLTHKATTESMRRAALSGWLTSAAKVGDQSEMTTASESVLATLDVPEGTHRLAILIQGRNHAQAGNDEKARELFSVISSATEDESGAAAAYLLSQSLFDDGQTEKAFSEVNKLVSSGTPHAYWLAKGFILLSDIFSAQGKKVDAIEYLKALKDNYPGDESEILEAINQRLNEK